jgi:glycosyltransferase involved in cell wall biosynthesis
MKVLHVTTWYPNPVNSNDALFIQRHIESLNQFVDHKVLHLQVTPARKFSYLNKSISDGQQLIFKLPFESWVVTELISAILLSYLLLRAKVNSQFDIINFHIAYPNLAYWHLIKKFIRTPIVITEHWSAYHFNFGVNKKLPKIQNIFKHSIPVITVSKALAKDIVEFSGENFSNYVVPNIVDSKTFYQDSTIERKPFLFMVSQWKKPKNPFVAMEAFLEITKLHPKLKLIIGGYGELWGEMNSLIENCGSPDKFEMLGVLNSKEIANHMRSCQAFLHPTEYETFSVVCAEAIVCGAPVIASNVGGIPEVVGLSSILIEENSVKNWRVAIEKIIQNKVKHVETVNHFSENSVGKQYISVLKKIISGTQ